MEILFNLLSFIESYKLGIILIILFVMGLWQYWKYEKEWNFRNYHKLIKELNQSDTPGEPIKLYRQIAVIYELRNYPRYFSVSKRILQGWLDLRDNKDNEYKNLYTEMQLSINYMSKNFIKRWFIKK